MDSSSQSPPVLRPEPRQLPTRSGQADLVAKQMPDPDPSAPKTNRASVLPRHPRHKSPVARFMKGIIFLILAGLVVYGVKKVLERERQDPLSKSSPIQLPTAPENPQDQPATAAPSADPSSPVIPVTEPDQPDIMQPAPELPGLEPVSPSAQATEVLVKFLGAKNLEERLPFIETKTPQAELQASFLNAPLPPTPIPSIDAIEKSSSTEQAVDYLYRVSFSGDRGQALLYSIVVRTRGSTSPKVVVDPMLDSYGGRLAAYAKTPSENAGIFQVVVSPIASCFDERIPNRENKLTLKLLPHIEAKEIVSAYIGRQSKIARMLDTGTYPLRYGKAEKCTVMLRWNTEDDADRPYLEALDIKAWDWNP